MKKLILFLSLLFMIGICQVKAIGNDKLNDGLEFSADHQFVICDQPILNVVSSVTIRAVPLVEEGLIKCEKIKFIKPQTQLIYTAGFSMPEDWSFSSILNVILTIISIVAGSAIVVVKKKGRQILELLTTILNAVDDNNISPDEEKKIVSDIRALLAKDSV